MNYNPYFQGTSPLAPAPPPIAAVPQQWGYPQPAPTDFIDQATKILNFVEALQQRGKSPQTQDIQGQPAQYSAGNFQAQTAQAIGEQERRLAQLATSTPNSSPLSPAISAQSLPTPSNNLESTLQQQAQILAQGLQAAIQERDMAYKVIDAIAPFMQVNAILNQEIEELDRMVAALVPFMQVAQIWAQEAIAHEQVLNNVLGLINDPEFLVYHAFQIWNNRIQHNGQGALDWIGDEFMGLVNTYEQRYTATNGRHSPIWERMQPKNINPVMGSVDSQNYAAVPPQFQQQPVAPQSQYQAPPMPPVPGDNGMGGPLDQLRQRIELMKSATPDLGQQMQRIHASQRQAMGVDMYV